MNSNCIVASLVAAPLTMVSVNAMANTANDQVLHSDGNTRVIDSAASIADSSALLKSISSLNPSADYVNSYRGDVFTAQA